MILPTPSRDDDSPGCLARAAAALIGVAAAVVVTVAYVNYLTP
jgi:hypothetical protein